MYGIEEEMCGTAWRDAYGWTWLHEDAEQQEWNMADWMADAALNKIASWNEGPEVNSTFDEPSAAKIAREALGA